MLMRRVKAYSNIAISLQFIRGVCAAAEDRKNQ